MIKMDTSPPTPPPKKHSAKKADRMPKPDCVEIGNKTRQNSLNQYRKDKEGRYWFELIPDKDKEEWRGMIHDSIMTFFNTMINTGQISDEITKEYKDYIVAVNKFLE